MTKSSVQSAKVAIEMVIISNYLDKNFWCTFTEMLDEKIVMFLIFELIKSWVASSSANLNKHKKNTSNLRWIKRRPWNTRKEK